MEGSHRASGSTVAKGRRTKRQRSHVPFLFEVSNVGDGDRGGCDREKEWGGITYLPGERIGDRKDSVDREEEEDMARCLILLSKGRSRDLGKEEVEVGYHDRPIYDQQKSFDREDQKFNSKRYLEARVGGGKIGYYVYECKTCNRTFPSFQALGGHRASHYKKPKSALAEEKKPFVLPPSMTTENNDVEAPTARFSRGGNGGISASGLYLQLSSSRNLYTAPGKYNSSNNSKVHECGICGAEFSSGQALGGHMRRHRGPAGTSPGFSSTPATPTDSEGPTLRVGSLVSLELDLNLPAPEAPTDSNNLHEASNGVQMVPPQPKQQQGQQDQPRLVFSVTALVDCHN
ncbi:hypothetical protein MLD38_009833 [Melastoma candidum]|uniref:Uncharacterized protein n=1 Tax=Melastoma candidum TaxID=119954 RepID=A0ACB9S2I5_9MYRT|nr:hypothetical protein MLD38_009833 [Melastoma candidum]